MPDTKDRTPSHEYAGPAFYSSPPASSLPVPKFEERSPAVAGVGTHPDHGEPKPPPDAITHINGASSDPKPCSPSRKSVPFTPDARSVPFTPGAKSHDGRTVSSTNNEQGEIIHETKVTVSAQRSVAFEELVTRVREDKKAQAKGETATHQPPEMCRLRQRQQAITDSVGEKSTSVIVRDTPQEMIEIRDQNSAMPANARTQSQTLPVQQMWLDQQVREKRRHVAENPTTPDGSGNLEQDLVEQQEIWPRRLDEIVEEVRRGQEREKGSLANDDERDPTSSSSSDEDSLSGTDDGITQFDVEVIRYARRHGEAIFSSDLSLAADFPGTDPEESEESAAVDDGGSETEGEAADVIESGEVEEVEDEGYFSTEETVLEQEAEGYFSFGGVGESS